jgi:hypothetical protein
MDAMSMTPRRSNPYDMDVDPREHFQLDKAFKYPAAYTNITEFLPNTVSPRDIMSPKKSTARRGRSNTGTVEKGTSRSSTKQKSAAVPSNHPHFFAAANTPKSRRTKPQQLLHQPTGFDSRISGIHNTPSSIGRPSGERTTTVSLEDSSTPLPFVRFTGSSRGTTRRKIQHLDITYTSPTLQTKDSFRSNLSFAPPGLRSVRFADLPANAPADAVSISHVSATASDMDGSEVQEPTTPNARTPSMNKNIGPYSSWRESSRQNDSDDEVIQENVDDSDNDEDAEIRFKPMASENSIDEMMQYVEQD